jgi:hypothetical protein
MKYSKKENPRDVQEGLWCHPTWRKSTGFFCKLQVELSIFKNVEEGKNKMDML